MAKASSTRMALWVILIAASPFIATAKNVDYGLQMFVKAATGSCWLDRLHKLPTVEEKDPYKTWGACMLNMKFEKNMFEDEYNRQVANQGRPITDAPTIKILEGYAMENIQDSIKHKLGLLDSPYKARCEKFVDNQNQSPAKDFSSLLGDSSRGEYAFKGLAHCILEVAEQRNGKQEMAALKSRWTSPKSFHQAIIDRENENRARHNTPPLTLDSTLNAQAQKWADKLAAANYCKMEHEKNLDENSANIKYHGRDSGENIFEGGYKDAEDGDAGVNAANGWYTEVQYYPWPAWKGEATEDQIGHFTQSVWKNTTLAGYGIGRSAGCDKVLIVGRYFPPGNVEWQDEDPYREYPGNVLPKNY